MVTPPRTHPDVLFTDPSTHKETALSQSLSLRVYVWEPLKVSLPRLKSLAVTMGMSVSLLKSPLSHL